MNFFTLPGSLALTFVVYWLFGGIYTLLDITNRPVALRRYKIQPGTNEPVDSKALMKVIAQVLFNQIVVGLPVVYCSYHLMLWRGFPPVRELPTFHWVLAEIAIHILFEEIGFYYSHRYDVVSMHHENDRLLLILRMCKRDSNTLPVRFRDRNNDGRLTAK